MDNLLKKSFKRVSLRLDNKTVLPHSFSSCAQCHQMNQNNNNLNPLFYQMNSLYFLLSNERLGLMHRNGNVLFYSTNKFKENDFIEDLDEEDEAYSQQSGQSGQFRQFSKSAHYDQSSNWEKRKTSPPRQFREQNQYKEDSKREYNSSTTSFSQNSQKSQNNSFSQEEQKNQSQYRSNQQFNQQRVYQQQKNTQQYQGKSQDRNYDPKNPSMTSNFNSKPFQLPTDTHIKSLMNALIELSKHNDATEKQLHNLLLLFMANHTPDVYFTQFFIVLLIRCYVNMKKFRTAESLLHQYFDLGQSSNTSKEIYAEYLVELQELLEKFPTTKFELESRFLIELMKKWPSKGVPRLFEIGVNQLGKVISSDEWANYFLLRSYVALQKYSDAEDLYEKYFKKFNLNHSYAQKLMLNMYIEEKKIDEMLLMWSAYRRNWDKSNMNVQQKQFAVASVLKRLLEEEKYEQMHQIFISTFPIAKNETILLKKNESLNKIKANNKKLTDSEDEEILIEDDYDMSDDEDNIFSNSDTSLSKRSNIVTQSLSSIPLTLNIATLMVRAYVKLREEQNFANLQFAMQQHNVPPNAFTISMFICGYARTNPSVALQLFTEYFNSPISDLDSFKFQSSSFLYQILLNGFAREGDFDQVNQLFQAFVKELHERKDDEILNKRRNVFIGYIDALLKQGDIKEAYRIFRVYFKGSQNHNHNEANQSEKEILVNPTQYLFDILISAFENAGETQMVDRLRKELHNRLEFIKKYNEKQSRFEEFEESL